jgi:hypothetical protein
VANRKLKKTADAGIMLDKKLSDMLRDYCVEKGVTTMKFLEEAIVEKMEVEGLKEEMWLYDEYVDYQDDAGLPEGSALYDARGMHMTSKRKH